MADKLDERASRGWEEYFGDCGLRRRWWIVLSFVFVLDGGLGSELAHADRVSIRGAHFGRAAEGVGPVRNGERQRKPPKSPGKHHAAGFKLREPAGDHKSFQAFIQRLRG